MERYFLPAAAAVRSSGLVLDESLRRYLLGVSLDLLASGLLVWATQGLLSRRWRLSLALACFGGLHLVGGWQRDSQELTFSLTVLLWAVGLGAHERFRAAGRARAQTLRRSACWAEYWQGQLMGFLRQVAFEAAAVLALLALLTAEARLILGVLGKPVR